NAAFPFPSSTDLLPWPPAIPRPGVVAICRWFGCGKSSAASEPVIPLRPSPLPLGSPTCRLTFIGPNFPVSRFDPDIMNRISSLSASNHTIAAAHRPSRPLMRTKPRRELPQCLLVPQHYERNYAYPLLVWLHDAGGDERELKKIMPLVSLRNYVSLAVRGTS